MLKFKPAPLYILDEVDAALDMAHTQNIGAMLKGHFTNSQVNSLQLYDEASSQKLTGFFCSIYSSLLSL